MVCHGDLAVMAAMVVMAVSMPMMSIAMVMALLEHPSGVVGLRTFRSGGNITSSIAPLF